MALARRARRRRHQYTLPTSPQLPPAVAADHQVKLYIDNGNGVRGKGHAARYTQVRQVRAPRHAAHGCPARRSRMPAVGGCTGRHVSTRPTSRPVHVVAACGGGGEGGGLWSRPKMAPCMQPNEVCCAVGLRACRDARACSTPRLVATFSGEAGSKDHFPE